MSFVKPDTVLKWHRTAFRLFWKWKSRRKQCGRPPVPKEIRNLIRRMWHENPTCRRIVHFAVTAHPTAEWAAYQILQAFPWDSAPRYLLRDRDRIFGSVFVQQLQIMGIEQVLSAPAAPWQRAYVERVIGTIRRECLNHVIILNQRELSRHLRRFLEYYHRSRCHLSLLKDAPDSRPIQPPEQGRVVSVPQVGGLHHLYTRRAA